MEDSGCLITLLRSQEGDQKTPTEKSQETAVKMSQERPDSQRKGALRWKLKYGPDDKIDNCFTCCFQKFDPNYTANHFSRHTILKAQSFVIMFC